MPFFPPHRGHSPFWFLPWPFPLPLLTLSKRSGLLICGPSQHSRPAVLSQVGLHHFLDTVRQWPQQFLRAESVLSSHLTGISFFLETSSSLWLEGGTGLLFPTSWTSPFPLLEAPRLDTVPLPGLHPGPLSSSCILSLSTVTRSHRLESCLNTNHSWRFSTSFDLAHKQ